ncbi:MAG: hypothetical protein WD005_02930 [Haliea sp.]
MAHGVGSAATGVIGVTMIACPYRGINRIKYFGYNMTVASIGMASLPISRYARPSERGMVLGFYASAGTLGRAISTIVTCIVLARIHGHASHALTMVSMFLLFIMATSSGKHLNERMGHAETNPDY